MVLPSFSPLTLISVIAGPEGAKNLAGEYPPPDSDPFNDAEFGKNLFCVSSKFAEKGESPIPFPQTPSAFHPLAQRTVDRRRDARHQ